MQCALRFASVAVTVILSGALLSGCGGTRSVPSVASGGSQVNSPGAARAFGSKAATSKPLSSPLSGEVLAASDVHVQNQLCMYPDSVYTTFTASVLS